MAEYKSVLAGSKDRPRLEAVWAELVSQEKAEGLIWAYLDEGEVEVSFTNKRRGRAKGGDCGFIKLPPEGPCLTRGLVLHEIAHVLMHNDKKTRGHGPEFVRTLDDLVSSEFIFEQVGAAA